MFAGLVLASLLAAPPPVSALPFDDKRFELHVGGRAGGRFGTGPSGGASTAFGGGVSLGLGVRIWQGLYFEASVGEGVYQNPEPVASFRATSFRHLGTHAAESGPSAAATDSGDSGDASAAILAGQILLGLRYEIRTAKTLRVRPSVFVGLTHMHEDTIADFLEHPGQSIGGISESIRHRTGAQVGLGLRFPFPERWGPVAPRFSARLDTDFAYYFDNYAGRYQAGAGLGLQVVF